MLKFSPEEILEQMKWFNLLQHYQEQFIKGGIWDK